MLCWRHATSDSPITANEDKGVRTFPFVKNRPVRIKITMTTAGDDNHAFVPLQPAWQVQHAKG